MFSGYKNYGLLPALLRIVYEETGAFDNHVVSVTRVNFSVEIHTEENFLGTYWVTAGENFDNFVDFIRYFDGQCTKRLYNDLLVIRYSYEIGSKLDPMFSSKKDLVFVVLPYLCDSKVGQL